jgi:probable phosphoglycerate mutase
MVLFVIRHGDPIYDPDTLTPKGHRQAEAVGKRFAVNGLDRIYSSPNGRAQDTARPTCELLGKEAVILDWTSENLAAKDFMFHNPENGGRYCWSFGMNPHRFREEGIALGDKWYETFPFTHCNAKEGFERIGRESDAFMESLGYKHEGKHYRIIKPSDERVAVFCHYGFGTTWLAHLLDIPPVLFWSTFSLTHTGITTINFQNHEDGYTTPQVFTHSDVSHILADRLPFEYSDGTKL